MGYRHKTDCYIPKSQLLTAMTSQGYVCVHVPIKESLIQANKEYTGGEY